MEDALKENQAKIVKTKKLKKRVIVKEEVQPEIILDYDDEEVERDIDDDVAISSKSKKVEASKAPWTEGPGASSRPTDQKAQVHCLTREKRQEILKTQKVLSGRVFDPEIENMEGMTDLMEMIVYHAWRHLFTPSILEFHEKEV
ncbi:hypothetical protein HAX54_051528 [Datura stramonium]|uniref:Uncharacterized protein n=1 Tax=Datura stramonium TaxID=4076 RepID=A0ABS8WRG8_DATST|nr:hypothetical protein [Datura stramonium]